MGELSMPMRWYVCLFLVAFWTPFRACLVVQTDAWERYGERATRCFEFGAAGQGRQQSRKRGSCGRADDLSKR